MDQREKVIQFVSRLGLNELCRHVSPSLLDAIEASGVSISAQNVSTILVDEFGVDVFQIDSLRAEFLNTLDSETLSHYINECRDRTGSADISAFKWGKNLSTEVFLGFFWLAKTGVKFPRKKIIFRNYRQTEATSPSLSGINSTFKSEPPQDTRFKIHTAHAHRRGKN